MSGNNAIDLGHERVCRCSIENATPQAGTCYGHAVAYGQAPANIVIADVAPSGWTYNPALGLGLSPPQALVAQTAGEETAWLAPVEYGLTHLGSWQVILLETCWHAGERAAVLEKLCDKARQASRFVGRLARESGSLRERSPKVAALFLEVDAEVSRLSRIDTEAGLGAAFRDAAAGITVPTSRFLVREPTKNNVAFGCVDSRAFRTDGYGGRTIGAVVTEGMMDRVLASRPDSLVIEGHTGCGGWAALVDMIVRKSHPGMAVEAWMGLVRQDAEKDVRFGLDKGLNYESILDRKMLCEFVARRGKMRMALRLQARTREALSPVAVHVEFLDLRTGQTERLDRREAPETTLALVKAKYSGAPANDNWPSCRREPAAAVERRQLLHRLLNASSCG